MVEEEEEGGPFCNELMCGEWLQGGRESFGNHTITFQTGTTFIFVSDKEEEN